MEAAVFDQMMQNMKEAHDTILDANQPAFEQGLQHDMGPLHTVGRCLTVMSIIHISVAIAVLADPTQKIMAYPTYKHVIYLIILGFMLISGFMGMMVGILAMENLGRYRRLTKGMLWASHLTTAFTFGFLLARPAFLPFNLHN